MSGHSHFSTIKRKKEITDKKRGQIFSKLSRTIWLAARQGSPKPEMNPKLRLAIEQARSFAMPKEKIERAIKKAVGELEGAELQEFSVEAYGPGKTAMIIEGITDNKNRTLNEIKQILTRHQGKLADSGSVQWLFERKGVITIIFNLQFSEASIFKQKEDLEMAAIESGADDLYWHNDVLDVYTRPEGLEKVKENLEQKGIKIDSASLDWVAKETIKLEEKDKEACQKLFEALDENDAVQDIYSNQDLGS